MTRYTVEIPIVITVEVEAQDEREAEQLAYDSLYDNHLQHLDLAWDWFMDATVEERE